MIPFPVLCAEEIAVMRALILHMFRHDSLEIVSMPSCTWHDPSPGFPQTPSHLCDLCRHFIQTSYQLGRQRLNEYLRFFPSLLQIFEYFYCRFSNIVLQIFRTTQNYVYTKFKDWVLKKSRNQEFYFSLGISRLFWDYFIPRYARDEIITKQSRNPLGKVKFSDFYFSSLINP